MKTSARNHARTVFSNLIESSASGIRFWEIIVFARKEENQKFINKIETCIIKILKEYNVKSHTDSKNIGIWVNNKNKIKKIAAIGIRVKKWIAYHGFSLNVNNDLSKYKKITPCGIRNKGITSLQEMGIKNFHNIDKIIIKKFLNTFL